MQAPAHIKTPAAYIAALAEPRRTEIQTLHDAIVKAAPTLKPGIGYGMLGYGPYHTTYASGREVDVWTVNLASQKNYISLYIGACGEGGYIAEANKHRIGKVSVGKSCIRFKKLADLDINVAMELVKQSRSR